MERVCRVGCENLFGVWKSKMWLRVGDDHSGYSSPELYQSSVYKHNTTSIRIRVHDWQTNLTSTTLQRFSGHDRLLTSELDRSSDSTVLSPDAWLH